MEADDASRPGRTGKRDEKKWDSFPQVNLAQRPQREHRVPFSQSQGQS